MGFSNMQEKFKKRRTNLGDRGGLVADTVTWC